MTLPDPILQPLHIHCAVLLLILAACGPEQQASTADTTTHATTTDISTTIPTTSVDTTEASGPPPPSCPVSALDETTTQTTDETAGPMSCPDHPTTDACCCFFDITDQGMSPFGTVSTCGAPALCPPMVLTCSNFAAGCDSKDLTVEDKAAIDCSLQALANGQIGRLSWQITGDFGFSNEHVELDLVGDSTVFRQGGYLIDVCYEIYPVQRLPLPAAGYFSDCLATLDWQDRFDCIRQALTCTPIDTCSEGYSYSPPFGLQRRRGHGDRVAPDSPSRKC